MKSIYHFLFLFVFCSAYSQNGSNQETFRVSSGLMSDLPSAVASDQERIAHFGFSEMQEDVSIEVVLWETSSNADTLSRKVLFFEQLIKKEKPRLDLLVNQNEGQVEIVTILAGKLISGFPIKPQQYRIQPFLFKSKPTVKGKYVPILLFALKKEDIEESSLAKILTYQDMKELNSQTIRSLKKKAGEFKVLSYHLKPLS